MSSKDGLVAAGAVVAVVLSLIALLSRPEREAVPPVSPAAPMPAVTAELEGKLARAEARARDIESKITRLEKRVADLESRRAAAPAPAPADAPGHIVIDMPGAVRNINLEELLRDRLGQGRGTRRFAHGGGDPVKELAKALDLTHDQRARVREIIDGFRETVDEKLPDGGRAAVGGGGMTDTLRKLKADLKARIAKVLDNEQRKKFDEYVASKGLSLAGTNTVWHLRETRGGGVAVTSTSVRAAEPNIRLDVRPSRAAPPPTDGGIGDPDGVF